LWSAYFSIDYKDVAAFSILAIVLIFMPSGLLGRLKWKRCNPMTVPSNPNAAGESRNLARDRDAIFAGAISVRPVRPADRFQDRPEHPQRAHPGPALGPASFSSASGHGRTVSDVGLYSAGLAERKAAKAAVKVVDTGEQTAGSKSNFNKIALACLFSIHLHSRVAGIQGSLKWVDNFGIQILIYVMLAWGLNIVVGLAGLLDLGYVAFYAVGAYSYALLSSYFGCRSGCCCRWPAFWRLLGRHPRLSGAAPARRLSRHCHAGLR
jgi:hypothetical protein